MTKTQTIKLHNAKTIELKAAAAAALEAYHAAVQALEEHKKTHPNFAEMEARRTARLYASAEYFEPGRSAEPGPR